MFFRYTVHWANDCDRGTDRGILFAENYGNAARKIEDYYGPDLCNLRLGMIEQEYDIGLEFEQMREILESMEEENNG